MAETATKAFGEILRHLRHQRGLSQEQLGFESGYHRTHISFLERGVYGPSLDAIFRLAAALNVAPEELVREVKLAIQGGPNT